MILTRDSIEQFQKYLAENGASPHTVRAYAADLKKLLREVGTTLTLTPEQVAASVTLWREVDSPKTTVRRIGSLRHYARWQGSEVLTNYRAPTPAPSEPHPLPEGIPGVLEMLHASERAEQRALIALCGLAGLRCHEARGVTPADIYDHNGTMLHVRGKGAKDRRVPLTDVAMSWIVTARDYAIANSQLTVVNMADSTARATIARIGMAVFGREVPSHDLRATFATAAYRASGNDLRAVQRLLGHASSDTTEAYVGTSRDEMRRAAEVS